MASNRTYGDARRRTATRLVSSLVAAMLAVVVIAMLWGGGPVGEVTIITSGEDDVEEPRADESHAGIGGDPGPAACERSEVGSGLMGAYNDGDVDAVRSLAGGAKFDDPVTLTIDPDADVSDVEEWVALGAEHHDTFVAGASAPDGREAMLFDVTRTHDRLGEHGLDAVGATYRMEVDSDCQIVEFVVHGPMVGQPDPCALAGVVGDRRELVAQACVDGVAGSGSRVHHRVVVAGDTMLVWGGATDSYAGRPEPPLLVYDVGDQQWSAIDVQADDVHLVGSAIWADGELLVVPTFTGDELLHVDPQTGAVERVSMPDYAQGASGGRSVWTGSELIIWGGTTVGTPPAAAAYDSASGRWRPIAAAPIAARTFHTMIWTGREVVVWGGSDGGDLGDGAAYDPATDTWRTIADAPVEGRRDHSAVWTGRELIVWGGLGRERHADGAAYDPATDTWRSLAAAPLTARADHSGVWLDDRMVFWGGWIEADGRPFGGSAADGAAYDPATDSWQELPEAPIDGRCRHAAVTLDNQMIVFGGAPCALRQYVAYSDGALLDLATGTWKHLPTP